MALYGELIIHYRRTDCLLREGLELTTGRKKDCYERTERLPRVIAVTAMGV